MSKSLYRRRWHDVWCELCKAYLSVPGDTRAEAVADHYWEDHEVDLEEERDDVFSLIIGTGEKPE